MADFHEWVNTQTITDDPQGDLISDMRRDPTMKVVASWERLASAIPSDLHEYAWPLWVTYRAEEFGETLPGDPPGTGEEEEEGEEDEDCGYFDEEDV